MEYGSEEMIFTRNELQNLASGLVLLLDYTINNNTNIDSNKAVAVNKLLTKINQQIDTMLVWEEIRNNEY